jgi:hypothetical protein
VALCFFLSASGPAGRLAAGAGPAPRPGTLSTAIVATDVVPDATAANNQVKIVHAPAGLVVAYVGMAGKIPQVMLALSGDRGARWSHLAQASSGPIPSKLPAIGADSAGRVYVTWTRYDDGVGKIYYRVRDARGWTAAQDRISPAGGYAGYQALAIDRSAHPQVLWYGIREGNMPTPTRHGSIYEILYTGFDGRAWSHPVLVSTGLPDSVNPALVSGPSGRLYAVWYQYDGRTYQVRYVEWDHVWGRPEGVYRTHADEFNPDLAVDAVGRVSLAWEHHDGLGSVIYYTRRSGGRWDEPIALSSGPSAALHPSVATTASGDVYVLWDQEDGQIYLRRLVTRWGPLVRLTADGGNSFPSAAADGAGVDIIWTHAGAEHASVVFARMQP